VFINNGDIDSYLGKEKRKDVRRQARWIVDGKFSNGDSFRVETANISKSGMSLNMPRSVKIGERAHIRVFAMINGVKMVIEAVVEIMYEVLSNNYFQCGLKFIYMRDKYKKELNSYAQNTQYMPVHIEKNEGFSLEMVD
jgi:c-di-GMP-binding flagellar brake protein YcgR